MEAIKLEDVCAILYSGYFYAYNSRIPISKENICKQLIQIVGDSIHSKVLNVLLRRKLPMIFLGSLYGVKDFVTISHSTKEEGTTDSPMSG